MARAKMPVYGKNLKTGELKNWTSRLDAAEEIGVCTRSILWALQTTRPVRGWLLQGHDGSFENVDWPIKRGRKAGNTANAWKQGNQKRYDYTVWNNYTDELVAFGTAAQCAAAMGLTRRNGFYELVTNVRKGRNKKYTITAEIVGKE